MSSTLSIVLVLICFAVLWAAWLLVPRWFARSIHRHRMWTLRDQLVDDIIAGRLPHDHPAVRQLARNIDRALRDGMNITYFDVRVFARRYRRLDSSTRAILDKRIARRPTDGLTQDQCKRIKGYETCWELLRVGHLMLGSWLGLAYVSWQFFNLATKSAIEAGRHVGWKTQISLAKLGWFAATVAAIARQATDTAAGSPMGHRVSETLPILPYDYAPPHLRLRLMHLHFHLHSPSNER
jgi:hypothetical protein